MATQSATETQSKWYNDRFVPEDEVNKYLPPYFRNTASTEQEVVCRTGGDWPHWLNGEFVRVGPAKWVVPLSDDGSKPNAVLNHFFDGLGMLHKFRMCDGQIHYQSKQTTKGVEREAKRNGVLRTSMFGPNANTPLKDTQDPCWSSLGDQSSMFTSSPSPAPDAANINVVPRRGMRIPQDDNPNAIGEPSENPEKDEYIVLTDFNMLQIVDAKSLEPKRIVTYAAIDPELTGYGICAHPPKDRQLGTTYNYLISEKGIMSVFALDTRTKPVKLIWKTPLPCPPCYIHSLAMTQQFVIFIRNPFVMDVSDVNRPMSEMLKYQHDIPTMFFVLEKSSGNLLSTYVLPEAIMFFHSVNAYDYQDPKTGKTNVHVDLCSYKGDRLPYLEYSFANILDPAQPMQDGTLVRYGLPDVLSAAPDPQKPATASVEKEISGVAMELPRIAKSASMKPGYRYVYATSGNGGPAPDTEVPIGRLGNGGPAAFLNSLAKTDWETGASIKWYPEDGESCPCEPVFVARPGASEEDDGVVLTIVIDRKGTKSILIALDGKTFRERARADMPQVYGLGPHGTFIEA